MTYSGRNVKRNDGVTVFIRWSMVLAGVVLMAVGTLSAEQSGTPGSEGRSADNVNDTDTDCASVASGSPYIPVDSWIYPAVLRLYALGYVDSVYLGMRPWTRASLNHMLEETTDRIEDAEATPGENEAEGIYEALTRELRYDTVGDCSTQKGMARVESVYSVARGISGTPLRDSFHLGSTIINDYGRP